MSHDRKHGRDRSAAERRPRTACLIGRDACDQFSSTKDTWHIFSMLVFMVVSKTSSQCRIKVAQGMKHFESTGPPKFEKYLNT